MKYLAALLLVVSCGKGGDNGGREGSWTIAGVEVPEAAIPQKLDVPVVLPKKIGDELLFGELFETKWIIPERLNIQYILGAYPNDDLVRGYQVTIYVDPMADLVAKWGTPTEKQLDEYGLSKCWTVADKKLEACVPVRPGKGPWNVVTTTTAPLPDRPLTPIPPEASGTYDEFPVGAGPCVVAGIQEISQIVGMQLQYLEPKSTDGTCFLLPASTKSASRSTRDGAETREVSVIRDVQNRWSRSDLVIEGLGDKAAWDHTTVQFQVKNITYRIRVNDPKARVRWLRDRALKIAHKVAARAQALPAE